MKLRMGALAVLLAAPASAQVKFVAPSVSIAPAIGNLAMPAAISVPSLGEILPLAPALTPTLPALPQALYVPKIERSIPVAAAEPVRPPESFPGESAVSAAEASVELGRRADSLAVERGLRADLMTGADFIGVVEAAARPRPDAGAGVRAVEAAMVRVVRALIDPKAPLRPQMGRLIGVWQVFNQEMSRVAGETGSVRAVVDEAELFASQVEASV